MKKTLLTLLSVLFCAITFAQSVPQGINYQAVARDTNGDVLKNQASNVKILKKCFVVGNDTNYYHNLILYLPKIISLISIHIIKGRK